MGGADAERRGGVGEKGKGQSMDILKDIKDAGSNLKYCMGTLYTLQGEHPAVAFDLSHECIQKAIKEKDPAIFDLLEKSLELAPYTIGLSVILNTLTDTGAGFTYGDPGFNEYRQALENLQRNPLADATEKTLARLELARFEHIERGETQSAVKQALTKIRREQFSKKQPRLLLALIERDGYTCTKCQSQDDLTIDHIFPISKGGSDDLKNLRLLCRSCNSKKGTGHA